MANAADSVLDKAENLARRVLERLGTNVDKRIAADDQAALSSNKLADLASRLERLIDSDLKEDERGVRRIAPNRFKVLFTYEETSKLSPQYIEAVGNELTATVFEYINNRRYVTLAPVMVKAERDLFTKETAVRAYFDTAHSSAENATSLEGVKRVSLVTGDGRTFVIELKVDAAPAYVGRAAGNSIRIDDENVSRMHCSLSLRPGGAVVVADVGSANGTCVNEQLLARDEARTLTVGDSISLGDCKLTVSEIS